MQPSEVAAAIKMRHHVNGRVFSIATSMLLQEVAEVLADTEAALVMVRRELQASPSRVVCRMSVAAQQSAAAASTAAGGSAAGVANGLADGSTAGHRASGSDSSRGSSSVSSSSGSQVKVQLLPDRYSEIMTAVVEVREVCASFDLCTPTMLVTAMHDPVAVGRREDCLTDMQLLSS